MSEKSFIACFFDSFRKYKFLFLFTVILAFVVLFASYFTFNTHDTAAIQTFALGEFKVPDFATGFINIIPFNLMMNAIAYVTSPILGLGGIFQLILNLTNLGVSAAATGAVFGDPLRLFKITLIHMIFEELSIIINTFSSLILAYFVILFIKDGVNSKESDKFKDSWQKNKIHLKYSFSVFIFGLILMFIAGLLEITISVPIGNMIVGA